MSQRFFIINTYHGNKKMTFFDTFEDAKAEAQKMSKKRKNSIRIHEIDHREYHGVTEWGHEWNEIFSRIVYDTDENAFISTIPCRTNEYIYSDGHITYR